MASISQIRSDVDIPLQSPQAQQSPGGAEVTDAPAVPDPDRLPDIFNLEWQREDTEFNRKYPPDPWGEEAGPNARVWKLYRDHHIVSDRGMLNSWNKTLDVLLIFAGLFSAVSTAFLIESYKALQPDYTQYVATFLYAAAVSQNRSGGVLPGLDAIVAPERFVQTSAVQRWTNGLWFSSLVISLSVALLCILVKQWLDEYDSHVSSETPSPKYWARRHSMYSGALKTWGVPGLISFLPLLLHLSLFLFFGGLVLFLLPLNGTIAYSLLVMVFCILVFYCLSLVMPAWRTECPSYTPLLSQALLTVPRGIACFIYLALLHKKLFRALWGLLAGSVLVPPIRALHTVTKRVANRLESIRNRQHLWREEDWISKWDQELDGNVLSALINLHPDTNWGTVNTACAAIGAITSRRTTNVIYRQVGGDVLKSKMLDCYGKITSRGTGFGITTHGQMTRATRVIMSGSHTPAFLSAPGLHSSLGIDGLLIQAMGVRDADGLFPDCDLLYHSLLALPIEGDRSQGFPLRSTCLLAIEEYPVFVCGEQSWLSRFFLVFCAGRFASADANEFERALRRVEYMLLFIYSGTIPGNNGGSDYGCAVINGIWFMLADERYHVDVPTAQRLAHQAYMCYERLNSLRHDYWVHQPGLSAFIRSPTFAQCVTTRRGLAKYAHLSFFMELGESSELQVTEYWECSAILMKLSWDCIPRSGEEEFLSSPDNIFPPLALWEARARRRYQVPVDLSEVTLSVFLDSPNAIATWTGAMSLDLHDSSILELSSFAYLISLVLCLRKRLRLANDVFIRGFFSGSFIFARFRDLVYRERSPGDEGMIDLERLTLLLAKHCLRLAPAALLNICTELEGLGDEGSALRARAVTFAQRMRDGSMPGGLLFVDCEANCYCIGLSARADAERGWGDVWRNLVTRFHRGRTEVALAV